jgi:hypothetical protein
MSEEREINEEDLILDFTKLDEGLAEQGAKLKGALMQLLGLSDYFRFFPAPSSIRGTRSQVSSFQTAAKSEKKYLDAVKRHGLNDPKTFSSKSRLNNAIRNFERETGMKWPLK